MTLQKYLFIFGKRKLPHYSDSIKPRLISRATFRVQTTLKTFCGDIHMSFGSSADHDFEKRIDL